MYLLHVVFFFLFKIKYFIFFTLLHSLHSRMILQKKSLSRNAENMIYSNARKNLLLPTKTKVNTDRIR